MALLLLAVLACTGAPDPQSPEGERPVPTGAPATGAPKALVIPADDPRWATMNGYLDHPGAYGEAAWDDVRMRVIGHVAAIGRDRARLFAGRGDFAGCAAAYRALVARLDGIRSDTPTGKPIRAALRDAAVRDAAFCDALANGQDPPVPAGHVAPLRARWQALARVAASAPATRAGALPVLDAQSLAAEARRVASAAEARATVLPLDRFADFEARHALRVVLVEAYADAVDPMRVTEPWGYWEPAEAAVAAERIAASADTFATLFQRLPAYPDAAAELRAAAADPEALAPVRAPVSFTAEALGALPTGDSYVDVAGFPGPRAIGTLAVLGLDDPAHRAWLDARAAELQALPSEAVPAAIAALTAELGRHPHGSRYYNVKQARNAAIRVLASRGAYAQAREVLVASWPLHAQDWACPDRAAILRGLEARLLVLAADPAADAALDAADAEVDAFLAHISKVEARGPVGPPSGPPGPPSGAPAGNPGR